MILMKIKNEHTLSSHLSDEQNQLSRHVQIFVAL
jgi:hypothetical protein